MGLDRLIPIKGFPGYFVSAKGDIFSDKKENLKKMKFSVVRRYYYVGLMCGKGSKMCRVHRLVAKAFIPNPKNYPHINHIDGNRFNNRVENLEWVTPKQNVRHAHSLGLVKPRLGRSPAGLTIKEVLKIKKLLKRKIFQSAIAKKYGVSQSTISGISVGRVWGYIG